MKNKTKLNTKSILSVIAADFDESLHIARKRKVQSIINLVISTWRKMAASEFTMHYIL